MLSKTQVDRLGDRLRAGVVEADLRLLDEYRRSFGPAYDAVRRMLEAGASALPPHRLAVVTGRAAKSVPSIVAKLRRESVRLTQIQDITGLRIVVADLTAQSGIAAAIVEAFEDARTINRLTSPMFGYRAIHVVVNWSGRPVEIQVRTRLQHEWAELSEIYSDRIPGLKYGDGSPEVLSALGTLSDGIYREELATVRLESEADSRTRADLQTMVEGLRQAREEFMDALREIASEDDE